MENPLADFSFSFTEFSHPLLALLWRLTQWCTWSWFYTRSTQYAVVLLCVAFCWATWSAEIYMWVNIVTRRRLDQSSVPYLILLLRLWNLLKEMHERGMTSTWRIHMCYSCSSGWSSQLLQAFPKHLPKLETGELTLEFVMSLGCEIGGSYRQ